MRKRENEAANPLIPGAIAPIYPLPAHNRVRPFRSGVCRSFHFRRRGGRAEERLERERGADADGARRTNFFKALHSNRSLPLSLVPSTSPCGRPLPAPVAAPLTTANDRATDVCEARERAPSSSAQPGRRRVVSVL